MAYGKGKGKGKAGVLKRSSRIEGRKRGSAKEEILVQVVSDLYGEEAVDIPKLRRELAKKQKKKSKPKPPLDEDSGDEGGDEGVGEMEVEQAPKPVYSKDMLARKLDQGMKEEAVSRKFGGGGRLKGLYPKVMAQQAPRDRSADRVQQLLQQLSTKLLQTALAHVKKGEFEVQALYIPNGDKPMLFISSNKGGTVAHLGATYRSLREVALKQDVGKTESEQRKFRKLRRIVLDESDDEEGRVALVMGDEDEDSDLGQLVELVKSHTAWSTVDVDAAAGQLKGGEGGIYLVDPESKTHAELTLVLALIRSGSTDEAYLQGSKRPCTGCYLATTYAQEKFGLSVTAGPRPGKLFGLEPARGFADMAIESEYGEVGSSGAKGVLEKEIDDEEWEKFTSDLKDWIQKNFPKKIHISQVGGKPDSGFDSESDSPGPSSSGSDPESSPPPSPGGESSVEVSNGDESD